MKTLEQLGWLVFAIGIFSWGMINGEHDHNNWQIAFCACWLIVACIRFTCVATDAIASRSPYREE